MCNFFGSFVGSIPVVAGFVRSAVNAASGVRTPLSGIVCGSMILVACAVLTPFFAYIPKAGLSAVIITASIFSVDIANVLLMWKSQSSDNVIYEY